MPSRCALLYQELLYRFRLALVADLRLRLLRPRKRSVKRVIKKAEEKSDREAFAARTVRDCVRVGDFESAFLQVLAVIED